MAQTNTAENARLEYEVEGDFFDFQALTNDGDNKVFTSGSDLWSGRSGYEPEVRPNGVITGGDATPGESDDTVAIAALTAYLAGVKESVSSQELTVTRPTSDVAKIDSVTLDPSASLVVVEGSEGSDQTFSEERGAGGGPPWIPTDSIEIAQVRMTSSAAAPLTKDQIKQKPGTHIEYYDVPTWEEYMYGGEVEFNSALPTIHSDDDGSTKKTKAIHASWWEPSFKVQPYSSDFTAPENSHSVNSEQVYGGTLASISTSLNQGSFTTRLNNGVTDDLVKRKNQFIWFRFYPDRNKLPHILCQGKLGIARTWPAGNNNNAEITISAMEPAQEEAS